MKPIGIFFLGVIVGGLVVAFVPVPLLMEEIPVGEQGNPMATNGSTYYNCELSGGEFENGSCTCPLEGEQTQAEMYDEQTGFCQSSMGGPNGDAFQASVGLPYGDYGYYQTIIVGLCESSGGSLSGAACMCPSGKTYNKSTGQCK